MECLKREVRDYVENNFLIGRSKGFLLDDESMLQKGVMDSTGVLELVAFLEERYGITVEDDELVPENMESIDRIAAYLTGKKAVV